AWIADNLVSDVWEPISPVSGELDAFEWKVPQESLASPEATLLEAEMSAAARGAAEPARPAPPPAPPPAPRPAAPPPPAPRRPPSEVLMPIARAPDDPGPDSEDDDIDRIAARPY